MKHRLCAVIGILCAMLLSTIEATVSLTPNGDAVVAITPGEFTGAATSPIAVSGSSAGFLLICEDASNTLNTVSYDLISQTWGSVFRTLSTATNINDATNGPTLVCNTPGGAMATWLANTIGVTSGEAYAGFTPDGETFSYVFSLGSVTEQVTIVGVSGTNDGFMFVWFDPGSNLTPYWAFATGPSWSVTSSGTIPNPDGNLVQNALVSGTMDTGFMAVWVKQDYNVYASYSDNEGTTWTTQQVSTSGDVDFVWVAGNSSGFLAVWVDSSYKIYSSFYNFSTGTWQESPTLIGSNVNTDDNSPFVTGNDTGFVVSYIDGSNNVYGVASTNVGTDWGAPVPITIAGNVSYQNPGSLAPPYDFLASYPWYTGVAMVDDTVVFAWLDTDGYVQSRFYTISSGQSTPRSFARPSNRR